MPDYSTDTGTIAVVTPPATNIVTQVIAVILAIAAAFGLDISPEMRDAILGSAGGLLVLWNIIWTAFFATKPATPAMMKAHLERHYGYNLVAARPVTETIKKGR